MRPVQDFRENFTQDGKAKTRPDYPVDDQVDGADLHETDSSVRNLCFVWVDGRRAFFNYAYLVSVELTLGDSINVMVLSFSGQIVTLKGYRLDGLFDLLLNHVPKTITASHPRYMTDGKNPAALVIDIMIKKE